MATIFLYIVVIGFIILVAMPALQGPPKPKEEKLDDQLTKTIRSIVIDELNKRLSK